MKHQLSKLALESRYYVENENGHCVGSYIRVEAIPTVGAVYLLWNSDRVDYVGITNNLYRRIYEHEKDKHFTHFSFYECDDWRQREDLEIVFFELLNPRLNNEHPADSHLRMHPGPWRRYYESIAHSIDPYEADDFTFHVK